MFSKGRKKHITHLALYNSFKDAQSLYAKGEMNRADYIQLLKSILNQFKEIEKSETDKAFTKVLDHLING